MSKVATDKVLKDSTSIEKVWKANPDMTLGKNGDKVALKDYQGSIEEVNELDDEIVDLRHKLDGLLDNRNDSAVRLSGLNTRALSAIRGIFGPDSVEYDQAGGTRSSERKKPTHKNGNGSNGQPK